ncbi:MAG: response regulator transcription factor [Acidobacteriota bacterium]
MQNKKIRVLLADDHAILRKGVRLLLNSQPDMEVVGEAKTGREAIREAVELKPDIVVMDVSCPTEWD